MSRIAAANAANMIEASPEGLLRAEARQEADQLGLENAERIEGIIEDQSGRATGMTNYGQPVEQPVADYLARNATQAGLARQQGLARGEGESASDHLDRLALDPNADLNRIAMEEEINFRTQHFARAEKAIREVLSRGVQNVNDPNLRRLASEFVMEYPREYQQIKAEMRRGETIPFDQNLMYEIEAGEYESERDRTARIEFGKSWVAKSVVPRLEQQAGRKLTGEEIAVLEDYYTSRDRRGGSTASLPDDSVVIDHLREQFDKDSARVEAGGRQPGAGGGDGVRPVTRMMRGRFDRLDDDQRQQYLDAAGGDADEAARLYDQKLRKDRGIDRESIRARRTEQGLAMAARSILRRHAGDTDALNRAMQNYNRRNPDMPLTAADLGLPSAGGSVTARGGDIVEAGSLAELDPSKVGVGAIISTPNGMSEIRSIGGGKKGGVPVMQDSASGFFFVDPNAILKDGSPAYPDQEAYDKALTRQDRIRFRKAILNSGNSVMAVEQRRLDAARNAASNNPVDEIRRAGLEEVARLEAEFHYRYITQEADLTGLSTGPREIEEIPERGRRSGEQTIRQPSIGDVRERAAEIRREFPDLDENGLMAKAAEQLIEEQMPYTGGAAGVSTEAAPPAGEVSDFSGVGTTTQEVAANADEKAEELEAKWASDFDKFKADVEGGLIPASRTGIDIFTEYFRGYGALTGEAERQFKRWWKTSYPNRQYSNVYVDEGHGQTYD